MALTSSTVNPATRTDATSQDLPAWYQQYSQSLGGQAMGLAQNLNQQPLPAASVAGFNSDQQGAFQMARDNIGLWKPQMNAAFAANNSIAPTAAKFIDYAQGAVGGPAQATGAAIQPWAQGAQDAVSGNAQDWTQRYKQYMSPYTSEVVDNIARLGKRNFENNIMPGVNSSMIGAGQFGSTRNADILSRAGVEASNDITGQQSNALQAGYMGSAGIFATDANRAQQQQQMQSNAALGGGQLMQGALSADANRVQAQQGLQANIALQGATGAVNAINTGVDNAGALAQSYQTLGNTDTQSLLNIGKQQQDLQQKGYDTAYQNAMAARTDPWTQLQNAQGIVSKVTLPTSTTSASSGVDSSTAPSGAQGALVAYLTSQGWKSPGG